MMISPELFQEEHEQDTYGDLLKVRERLLTEIYVFENAASKSKTESQIFVDPSPDVVYRCNLGYLAKTAELLAKKYREMINQPDDPRDGGYLYQIQDFLKEQGIEINEDIGEYVFRRERGKSFPLSEHVRAMVYAMLSNQTKWHRIVPNLPEIDKLFFDYDPDRILEMDGRYFTRGIKAIKCGNISTARQMNALSYNIDMMRKIEKEYGSMDAFVESGPPDKIVQKLSHGSSPYKLKMLGEALTWEYLRNVGIDSAKPDTHLRRFLGSDRMGRNAHKIATVNEVNEQIAALTKETDLLKVEIDNLIWLYCSDGYGEICTKTPHCAQCVIREFCHKKKKV